MTTPERSFVIVGASLAGTTAAATLRAEGFDGGIVMIGAEPHPPYERPPLSKEYLRGDAKFEQSFIRAPEWYAEEAIDLRLGTRARTVDTRERIVVLEDGAAIPWGALLLATGSRNRRLDIPGAELEGVLDLRRVEDADHIRAAATSARRAVVVGGGFIGSEVAACLRQLGLEVTLVGSGRTLLERVLGPEVGGVLEAVHRDHGARMVFDDPVASFEGGTRVEVVVTASGRRLECDFVVAGVGVLPNTEAVAGTDIHVDDGVVVDDHLGTNVEGVFAAGDVAALDGPGGRSRVEHYDHAIKTGVLAARSMLGHLETLTEPAWFWSEQFDLTLQMAGTARRWDQVVFRGSLPERRFTAFYLHDGRLLAAASVNRPRDARRAMKLISAGARPDPVDLRDEDVDLRNWPRRR